MVAKTAAQQQAIDEIEASIGTDLARAEARQFNAVSVRNLSDVASVGYDEMEQYLRDAGIDVEEATPETVAELTGDGFTKIDKSRLVNVPFIILTWSKDNGGRRIAKDDGSDGDGFYIVRAVTKMGEKVWFTTGGYGLAEELTALANRRKEAGSKTPNAGYKLPKGLHADPLPDYPGKFIFRSEV